MTQDGIDSYVRKNLLRDWAPSGLAQRQSIEAKVVNLSRDALALPAAGKAGYLESTLDITGYLDGTQGFQSGMRNEIIASQPFIAPVGQLSQHNDCRTFRRNPLLAQNAEVRRAQDSALPLRLQRAKEVQEVLLLRRTQRMKSFDYLLRLRRHAATQQAAEEAAVCGVCANRVQQIGSATVVKEKQTLPQAPERRRAELVSTGCALRDSIG